MRTEGTSIVAALAFHAALLLVARAMPPLSSLVAGSRRPLDTIDIVELPPSRPVAEVQPAPTMPEAPRTPTDVERPQPGAHVDARAVPRTPGPQAPATAEAANPPPPGATQKPQWDSPPEDNRGVLGLPPGLDKPLWTMQGVLPIQGGPPPPAPTVAPAPRPVDPQIATRIINDELNKKDKDLGLDIPVAGTIASAVKSAVQSSDIAAGTQGSIECRVSASGKVTGCKLVGSNGGNSGSWAQAVSAAGAVAGAALGSRYDKGAIVTISISVSNSPPAGSKGGISGATASFDISNIGAHATRMVRTSRSVVAVR